MTPGIQMTTVQDRADLGAWKGLASQPQRGRKPIDQLNESARVGAREVEAGKVSIAFFANWMTDVARSLDVDVAPIAYAFMAYHHHLAGRQAEAESYYRKALAGEPGNPGYRLNLANILGERGELAEASSIFDALIAENPRDVKAWNGKGNIESARGDLLAAEQCYGKALEVDPKHRAARINLGLLDLKKGEVDEGLAIFERFLREKPDDPDALSGEADAFFCKGDLSMSLSLYERVMEIAPSDETAVMNAAIVLTAKGAPDAGILLLEARNEDLKSDRIRALHDTLRANLSAATDLARHFDTVIVDVPKDVDISDWDAFSAFLREGEYE